MTLPGTHRKGSVIAQVCYGATGRDEIQRIGGYLSRMAAAGKIPGVFRHGKHWMYPVAYFQGQRPKDPKPMTMTPRLLGLLR